MRMASEIREVKNEDLTARNTGHRIPPSTPMGLLADREANEDSRPPREDRLPVQMDQTLGSRVHDQSRRFL